MTAQTKSTGVRALVRHALHLEPVEGLTEEELQHRRRHRIDILIAVCWVLIALKTVVVIWAVNRYNMPFNPAWVVAPTVSMAGIATGLYYWIRD